MSLASILARRPGGSIPIRWADGTPPPDPGLAFMLAQQKTTQLQLDTHRLALAAETASNPAPIVAEAELSLAQIAPLRERISPFANYVDMAIRFEAQEVMAALEAVEIRLTRILQRLKPDLPWRDPAQLAETLRARTH